LQKHIAFHNSLIINFSFSRTFADSILAKQTGKQNTLKAKRDLDRIKVEPRQTITATTAEGEILRLQKRNVTFDLIDLINMADILIVIKK